MEECRAGRCDAIPFDERSPATRALSLKAAGDRPECRRSREAEEVARVVAGDAEVDEEIAPLLAPLAE